MENQFFKENANGFALMSWEQDPKKRKFNNVVKFNINESVDVNIGDVILGVKVTTIQSQYTIIEIIESRPSSVKGKKYVTVKTNWESVNLQENN